MSINIQNKKSTKIINIHPSNMHLWAGNDRLDFELETEEMKASLLANGQTSPLIVRPFRDKKQPQIKYEIIDGQRRFHAAKLILKSNAEFTLKAVVQELDDKQAYLVQLTANKKDSLSGYSQALSYKNTLDVTGMKQFELAQKLNIAKSTLTRRLSYLQIDQVFWDSLPDKRMISDSIANNIVVLLNKAKKISEDVHAYTLHKLIAIFKAGYSRKKIQHLYNEIIRNDKKIIQRIYNSEGTLLCIYHHNGTIKIASKIAKKINMEKFEKDLSRLLSKYSA